jgi:hypothetical protein
VATIEPIDSLVRNEEFTVGRRHQGRSGATQWGGEIIEDKQIECNIVPRVQSSCERFMTFSYGLGGPCYGKTQKVASTAPEGRAKVRRNTGLMPFLSYFDHNSRLVRMS